MKKGRKPTDRFPDDDEELAATSAEELTLEQLAAMEAELHVAKTTGRALAAGQKVRGTIIAAREDCYFVDIGDKAEAVLQRLDSPGDEAQRPLHVGDRIEAFVLSTKDGTIELSQTLDKRAQTQELLMEAYRTGVPVEGRVLESVRGGYRIGLGESRKGFCPLSQIDMAFTQDAETHVGQTYTFRIVEARNGGKDLVLSRRKLLEEEREVKAAALREQLVPGARLVGTVRSIQPFGAFIDLGGLDGLLHVSEMGHERIESPAQVVSVGQRLEVVVKGFDTKSGRIALTRKPLLEDPWSGIEERYPAGLTCDGRVTRLLDFGAFVELEPGVEGLLHISEIAPGKRLRHASEGLSIGDEIAVRIQSVDPPSRRISLARSFGEAGDETLELAVGVTFEGIVEGQLPHGVLVGLPGGQGRGLLPNRRAGEGEAARAPVEPLPVGSKVRVQVIYLSEGPKGKQVRLALPDAEGTEERDSVARFKERARSERGNWKKSSFAQLESLRRRS
ncbi:MAG: S1 RNA-binding domain-containing protein [Candidatus Schekmanbacteria bacterium]|nr:S1 RNA-binding domain-containing protein [Candidatus Schekmanbacteria bacterium]